VLKNIAALGWSSRYDNFLLTERQLYREKVGELLAEKILFIAESMNRSTYVPKMPNQPELELIFDTSFIDIQPYLFEVSIPLLFSLRPPNETCP
jgi:hypothetical protein